MLVKLHAIMWLQGMFSKLGFPILTTYCGANFVPWWLGSFWYFLIDLIPGSSLALDCYAMYVWHFFLSDILLRSYIKGKYTYILGDDTYRYVNISTHFSFQIFRCGNITSSTALPPPGKYLILYCWLRESKNLTLFGHSLREKKKSYLTILPLKYQHK